MKNYAKIAGYFMVGLFLSGAALAQNEQVKIETQPFTVKLGASRVIYNPDLAGISLSVINIQDYPMLVQTKVLMANQKDPAPFVVTPPLFRLDGDQQSRLRIVSTSKNAAQDRETLYWLCVTGIPPMPGDAWNENKKGQSKASSATLQAQIRIQSCIKLLVRPSALKGVPADHSSSLVWQREGNKLKVTNPTPFFFNLKKIQLAGHDVKDINYVAPFSSETFDLPAGKSSGSLRWTLITDAGGESREYTAAVK